MAAILASKGENVSRWPSGATMVLMCKRKNVTYLKSNLALTRLGENIGRAKPMSMTGIVSGVDTFSSCMSLDRLELAETINVGMVTCVPWPDTTTRVPHLKLTYCSPPLRHHDNPQRFRSFHSHCPMRLAAHTFTIQAHKFNLRSSLHGQSSSLLQTPIVRWHIVIDVNDQFQTTEP